MTDTSSRQAAPKPCHPCAHKSMAGQIFLEPAWQGGSTVLLNCLTGEREPLPPTEPDDQWTLAGLQIMGATFNKNVFEKLFREFVWNYLGQSGAQQNKAGPRTWQASANQIIFYRTTITRTIFGTFLTLQFQMLGKSVSIVLLGASRQVEMCPKIEVINACRVPT